MWTVYNLCQQSEAPKYTINWSKHAAIFVISGFRSDADGELRSGLLRSK